ncbi:hypothetical protein [Halosolutus gelatinilyticus]|uniref:hypothetical protein n=1 Tax=Halosolutus gelatinilyticus TaxID=2931975 RepID=UPI001FF14066|nr:hypothetical protein [Halosolutus gelatinilyticus]
MMLSRRELFAASAVWLLFAALCAVVDAPYLRPVVVGSYLLVVPGLSTLLAIAPESPRIEITVLGAVSVVFSLAWIAVATTLLAIGDVPLGYLFPLSGLWIAVLSPRIRSVAPKIEYTRSEGAAIGAIVLAVVVALVVPHFRSARVSLSAHGALHSSMAYSVVHGAIPPVHPGFAYEPYTAYYWTYHVLLAGLSETMGIVPVYGSLVLTWFSMAAILALLYRLARDSFGLSPRAAGVAMVGPVWAMSTVVPIVERLLGIEVRGTILLPGRIGLFVEKFLTISGFPLGLFLFATMTVLLFRALSEGTENEASRVTWAGFVAAAVLLFHVHTSTAVFAFPALGIATLVAVLDRYRARERSDLDLGWTAFRPPDREWLPIGSWIAIGLCCLPFFYALVSAGETGDSIRLLAEGRRAFGPVTLEGPHAQYLRNACNFAVPFLVAGPLAAIGYRSLRSRHPREARVLAALALAIAAAGIVVTLPDANQYKAAYMLAVPIAPLAAVGLVRVADRLGPVRPVLALAFVAILIFNPIAFLVTGPLASPLADDHNYEFEETDVRLSGSAPYDPAPFEWVAENASTESSIVVSPSVYDELAYQPANVQTELIVAALTERPLYYAHRELPAHLLPADAAPRGRDVDRLLACEGEAAQFADREGPLYAIVTTGENERGCDLHGELEDSDRWTRRAGGESIGVFEFTPDDRHDR